MIELQRYYFCPEYGSVEKDEDGKYVFFEDADRQIKELQAKVAELEKDKERLDWLADPFQLVGYVSLPSDIVKANLHSLRDGIDQAIETMKGIKP